MVGQFLVNSGHCCGRGATLGCRNLLLSPNNITQGLLLTIEWLVTNVTAVVPLENLERAVLAMILGVPFVNSDGKTCGLGATM